MLDSIVRFLKRLIDELWLFIVMMVEVLFIQFIYYEVSPSIAIVIIITVMLGAISQIRWEDKQKEDRNDAYYELDEMITELYNLADDSIQPTHQDTLNKVDDNAVDMAMRLIVIRDRFKEGVCACEEKR